MDGDTASEPGPAESHFFLFEELSQIIFSIRSSSSPILNLNFMEVNVCAFPQSINKMPVASSREETDTLYHPVWAEISL